MRKLIILAIVVFWSSLSFAQGTLESRAFNIHSRTIDLNEKMLAFGLTEAQIEAIKDDAYANPEFRTGNIYQIDQLVKSNVQLRYNALEDEIEIKERPSDTEHGALVKDPDIFVKIGTDLYIFVPFEGSKEKGGYFNVLTEGETYDLYKKVTSVFREGKEAETSYDRATPPSFAKTTTFYLVQKDGDFLQMPSSRRNIMRMFSKKKKEMDDYIKKNRLDVRKEADLIKAVSHFDKLISK